jgi:hypothetical protein
MTRPIDEFTAARIQILEKLFDEQVDDDQLVPKFRERSGGWGLDMFMGDWQKHMTDDVIVKFTPPVGSDREDEFIYIHTGDDPYYIPLVMSTRGTTSGMYSHEL